jgi:hypothetical protein
MRVFPLPASRIEVLRQVRPVLGEDIERICIVLKLSDSDEHLRLKSRVSALIIECAEAGERDVQKLIDCAHAGLEKA